MHNLNCLDAVQRSMPKEVIWSRGDGSVIARPMVLRIKNTGQERQHPEDGDQDRAHRTWHRLIFLRAELGEDEYKVDNNPQHSADAPAHDHPLGSQNSCNVGQDDDWA